jgi:cyclopropane-fatty-acyl-phospholipid synthase
MNTRLIPANEIADFNKPANWFDRLAKRGLFSRLSELKRDQIIIHDGSQAHVFGEGHADDSLSVTITVNNPQFYSDIAFGGSVAAGESYFLKKWDCSDLTALVRILLRNRSILDGMDDKSTRLKAPTFKLIHWLNRNTRKGSQRNIESHYNLGNELFRLFLDKNMMYSSALYTRQDMTLEEASDAKLQRICEKLNLQANDHVLEIGTGWGGFAIYAATHFDCKVTTTTISSEQYELACIRVKEAGLSDKIQVLFKDYRDLEGTYDKLVSIEMIEAIGHQYMPVYFKQCSHLLKPDGMMLLQAITIADQRYQTAIRSVDFIQRYIFPGSFIPSVTAMTQAITRHSDMKLVHLEDIGPHYATTLNEWRQRFIEQMDAVKALGYSEAFTRMWLFYLCYCEGGFIERAIGDVHMLLAKPDCRQVVVGVQSNY